MQKDALLAGTKDMSKDLRSGLWTIKWECQHKTRRAQAAHTFPASPPQDLRCNAVREDLKGATPLFFFPEILTPKRYGDPPALTPTPLSPLE